MTPWLDGVLAVSTLSLALALRPWRLLDGRGPPWPWLAWALLLPALWSAERWAATPVVQPLSGAGLLVLLMGRPLAMLVLPGVALLTALVAGLDAAAALHRRVWLGVAPGTLALLFGLALRRWLPHNVFVYILGRGFVGTALATAAAGALSATLHEVPDGLAAADVALGRWLAAWGDAWQCGMVAAIFVALPPAWLATYADRLYLPPSAPGPAG